MNNVSYIYNSTLIETFHNSLSNNNTKNIINIFGNSKKIKLPKSISYKGKRSVMEIQKSQMHNQEPPYL